jgi:hypothetical protein
MPGQDPVMLLYCGRFLGRFVACENFLKATAPQLWYRFARLGWLALVHVCRTAISHRAAGVLSLDNSSNIAIYDQTRLLVRFPL